MPGPLPAARIFALLACSATGSLLAFWLPHVLGATAAVLVAGIATLRRRGWRTLAVAFLALGWLLAAGRIGAANRAVLAQLAAGERRVDLVGEIVRPPERSEADTTLTVRIRQLEVADRQIRVRERISVVVRSPPWATDPEPSRYEIGDVIAVRQARLRSIEPYGFAQRVRTLRERVVARVFVDPDEVTVTGRGGGLLLQVARWGRSAVRRAAAPLPDQPQALLLGVTIGDTSGISPQVDEDFRRTGLTHLVAVSGANLAIVLSGVLLLLRACRVGVRAIPWLLGGAAAGFCAIAAFEPSVVRAGAMALLALIAFATGASRRALDLLALAAFLACVADPFLALTTGFQLSVLATWGLVTIARRLGSLAAQRPILLAMVATVGAQLATMPLLAIVTGRISMVSLPANLAVAPFVAPVTILGLAAAGLGSIVPPLRYLAVLARPFLATMLLLTRLLADLPGAILDVPGGAPGLVFVLALALLAIVAARGRGRAGAIVAAAILLPLAAGLWSVASRPPPLLGLTITMIDVGQGEAILITEGEHAMLIDGGPADDVVPRFLRDRGIHRLDYLVVSHPHDDHVSGLVGVAERATIGRILDPTLEADLADYDELLEVAEARRIPHVTARAGQVYPFGDATIRILWPPEPLLEGTDSDLNENSIVLRIDLGSDAFLYAGETQEEAQLALVERGAPLQAEVLKVSHHGSARMHPEFYRASGAQVAMIPVGRNSYGHPAPETLVALHGMQILRSDQHGDVAVTIDGQDRLAVRTEHGR